MGSTSLLGRARTFLCKDPNPRNRLRASAVLQRQGSLHIHRLGAIGAEVKAALAALLGTVRTEAKLLRLAHRLIRVLFLVREVLLDDVVRLHVNLLVGVGLAVVDLFHTAALLDKQSKSVDRLGSVAGSLLVKITDLEDVLQTIEGDLDDFVIRAGEEIAEGLDAALLNQVADLLGLLQTTRRGVADCPAGLLTRLEIAVGEQMNQRRNDVGVNNRLDLSRVAGRDVGDGPAGLLANAVLVGAQQRQKAGQSAAVDDDLGLNVVAGDYVADGAKCWGLNRGRGVHEELHKTAGDASLNDGLDLVIGTVGEIRDSPARVDQDLVIQRIDQLGENWKGGGNLEQKEHQHRATRRTRDNIR